jgi:hypothetical protein
MKAVVRRAVGRTLGSGRKEKSGAVAGDARVRWPSTRAPAPAWIVKASVRPGRLSWPLLTNTSHLAAKHEVAETAAKRPAEPLRDRRLLPRGRRCLEAGAHRVFMA